VGTIDVGRAAPDFRESDPL